MRSTVRTTARRRLVQAALVVALPLAGATACADDEPVDGGVVEDGVVPEDEVIDEGVVEEEPVEEEEVVE